MIDIDNEINNCLEQCRNDYINSKKDNDYSTSTSILSSDFINLRGRYLLELYLTNKNVDLLNENEPLLRKLSGLTVKAVAQRIGISGPALTQFETRKSFPIDRVKPLVFLYIETSFELLRKEDYRLFNCLFSLFYFAFDVNHFIITSRQNLISSKHNLFEKIKSQFENNQKLRSTFVMDIDEFKNDYVDSFVFLKHVIKGPSTYYLNKMKTIFLNGKEVSNVINRNLKNLRFLTDMDQQQFAKILGITCKSYNYIENYDYKPGKNAIDLKQTCVLINAVFDKIFASQETKKNSLRAIKMLWPEEDSEKDELYQEAINDYCIAIKYRQSKITLEYFDRYFTFLEIKKDFKLSNTNFWDSEKENKAPQKDLFQ